MMMMALPNAFASGVVPPAVRRKMQMKEASACKGGSSARAVG